MFLTTRWRVATAAAPEPAEADEASKGGKAAGAPSEADEVPLPFLKKRRQQKDKEGGGRGREATKAPDEPAPKKKKQKKQQAQPEGEGNSEGPVRAGRKEKKARPVKGAQDEDGATPSGSKFKFKDAPDPTLQAKADVSQKTRANQHAKRRARTRRDRKKAAKEVERLREAKKYEKRLPEISAAYLQAWAKKQDGGGGSGEPGKEEQEQPDPSVPLSGLEAKVIAALQRCGRIDTLRLAKECGLQAQKDVNPTAHALFKRGLIQRFGDGRKEWDLPSRRAHNVEPASSDRAGTSDDKEWHFSRATQRWLLQHAYEPGKVDKDTFALLLRYLEGIRGSAKDQLEQEAAAMVKRKGAPAPAAPEDRLAGKKKKKAKAEAPATEEMEPDKDEKKARIIRVKRARRIISVLESSKPSAETAAKTADT